MSLTTALLILGVSLVIFLTTCFIFNFVLGVNLGVVFTDNLDTVFGDNLDETFGEDLDFFGNNLLNSSTKLDNVLGDNLTCIL